MGSSNVLGIYVD